MDINKKVLRMIMYKSSSYEVLEEIPIEIWWF